MIKLYGIALSSNVNKVRYCLDYLKLPYEMVQVNPMKGENQTSEYLNTCPTGKIPAMEIDGLKLFESNAMIRYLAKREQSPLYPQDAKQAAMVDAWLDFPAIHISQAMGRVGFNRVIAPMVGKDVDDKSLQFGLEMMEKYLPVIEKQLKAHPYLAGDALSIADVNLLAILDPCEMFQVDLALYTNVTRWRSGLQGEEFYQPAAKDQQAFMQAMTAKQ